MSISRGPDFRVADDPLFECSQGAMRRDSDWGEYPRAHEEDLAWAARRAAVSMGAATLHATGGGTGAHSDDVVHLCDAIAEELGIHGSDRAELLAAAQLHDIGKVAIPHTVLEKPAPLDEREWALIREHTVAGQKIVQSVPELAEVARLVRHSHERWDGSGYPDGLAGQSIPLASRVVFCADAFHAIRSDRPYRRGRAATDALDEVNANAGTQFDPEVAAALVKCAGRMRSTAGREGPGFVGTTLRFRRLVSLLLTLAIGGTALAAGGFSLLRDENHGKILRDENHGKINKVAPTSAAATPALDGAGRAANEPGGARQRAARRQAPSRSPAGGSARRDRPVSSSTGSPLSPQVAPQAAAAEPSPIAPTRRRIGLSGSPGRSGDAPRRPAQPGRPIGGAPGRSEEAPGRPTTWPVLPAQAPRAATPELPVAEAHGRVVDQLSCRADRVLGSRQLVDLDHAKERIEHRLRHELSFGIRVGSADDGRCLPPDPRSLFARLSRAGRAGR